MYKGRVYWITGLPGSGKTTIGTALFYRLRQEYNNIIILDGDILKRFVGDSVGYSQEERLSRARKYSDICKILADQGMWVVICTVALFHEIRKWNRENIDGYVEVFLDTPFEVLKKRDKKGIYSNNNELLSNAEFPCDPDIVIKEGGDRQIDSILNDILAINPRTISDYDRDKEYWNSIYKNDVVSDPSPFAKEIIRELKDMGGTVLEIGCGDGRDSLFFVRSGLRVVAIDASDVSIEKLIKKTRNTNATFICDDFVKCKAIYCAMYESIYSRFTLHAITDKQEDELLTNIRMAIKDNGKLYIEARSINDDLFGKGKEIDHNAYEYNGHFRRFIDKEELVKKLTSKRFRIISVVEGRGFSKTDNEDPVLIRIIATPKE